MSGSSRRKKIVNEIRNAVDSAVMVVKKLMFGAILMEVNILVMPRVEMAVRSITESSERGPNNVVQNPDQGDFTLNTKETPVMSASSRIDLNVGYDRNDETRNIESLDDGDFPASTPNFHTNESEAAEVCTFTQEEINEQTKSFIAPLTRQPEDLTRLVQVLLVASHPNH